MAVGAFGMPVELVVASAAVGVVFALFRIAWLIVAAVFLYDIAVAAGAQPVGARELLSRLLAAGLRARKRHEPSTG